ncbi:DUF6622 family protein [Niveibacterium microcysteis]|uniref:DUF1453 domain-containing protein n=1 Tax=Niveibacterium microcysteis TaxID=2811415 RepID=A0ABX7MB58_9RHOO|nr:DUF6622 family protein [Niveibacterium microcysteis]QSI78629.1 hypothetical protein JY500_08500 [Niveibacterium microcysteis]
MILQILANTPAWVFALFFFLLGLGLMQTRTRTVRRFPALILPAGMVVLSLAGINSSFGLKPLPLLCWASTLVIASLVGHHVFRDARVTYNATTHAFVVPGSWVPLTVIMAIFFAKYVYAVMHALNAAVLNTTPLIVALSALYGLLSGYFTAKALNLIHLVRKA